METLTVEAFDTLVREVAGKLPAFDYVTPKDGERCSMRWRELRGAGTVAVAGYHPVINLGLRDGRMTVSGDLPGSLPYGVSRPSITVDPARGPAVIAREIERRFLPEYLPVFATVAKSCRESADYMAKGRTGAAALAALVPGSSVNDRHGDATTAHFPTANGWYGEARVNGETVTLELRSLPFDTAAAILKTLVRAAREAVQ